MFGMLVLIAVRNGGFSQKKQRLESLVVLDVVDVGAEKLIRKVVESNTDGGDM